MSQWRRAATAAGWLGQVLAWSVISAVVVVLALCVIAPRLGGATPYTVLTGSMRPDFPPGTLVVVRPVAFDAIRIGDVVTYQLHSGEPEVVTHRVVGLGDEAGRPVLLTRGDANDAIDREAVREEQVRGVLWYRIPELGRVNLLMDRAQHHALALAVGLGLLAYAGLMTVGALRDRRRQEVSA